MNQIRLEKVCEMILFIGGPVDWGMGGRRHGRHGWGHWIPWERLRDSPELRVWRKRIRSDDRQTNGQMDRISTCRLDPWKGSSKNHSTWFAESYLATWESTLPLDLINIPDTFTQIFRKNRLRNWFKMWISVNTKLILFRYFQSSVAAIFHKQRNTTRLVLTELSVSNPNKSYEINSFKWWLLTF